jgi:hypothetical protein
MLTIEANPAPTTNEPRSRAGFIIDGANYRSAEAPTTNERSDRTSIFKK